MISAKLINVSLNLAVLKDLFEKQTPVHATDSDDDGKPSEYRKRYLILVSTVMTWAVTKPLDPVSYKKCCHFLSIVELNNILVPIA